MSRTRWLLSLMIVYHLAALLIDALPAPGDLNAVAATPGRSRLRMLFDDSASMVSALDAHLYALVTPLRPATQPYIHAGLRQKWNMFSNPFTSDRYVRLEYAIISSSAHTESTARELIFPTAREDRMRGFHDFRDKAISNTLEAFASGSQARAASMQTAFVPLVRYFRTAYADRYLTADERITRTSIWVGTAAIPPPGHSLPDDVKRARLTALRRYYDEPVRRPGAHAVRELGVRERDADIVWTLTAVDEQ